MMRLAPILIVATFLSLPVDGYSEAPPNDLTALQGTWKAWRGNDAIVIEVKQKIFTMTTYIDGRASEPWTGTLVFDETVEPRHITWKGVKVGEKDLPENQCIYEVHGDTWLLIGGGPDKRPDRFLSGGGQGNRTLIFKREKVKK